MKSSSFSHQTECNAFHTILSYWFCPYVSIICYFSHPSTGIAKYPKQGTRGWFSGLSLNSNIISPGILSNNEKVDKSPLLLLQWLYADIYGLHARWSLGDFSMKYYHCRIRAAILLGLLVLTLLMTGCKNADKGTAADSALQDSQTKALTPVTPDPDLKPFAGPTVTSPSVTASPDDTPVRSPESTVQETAISSKPTENPDLKASTSETISPTAAVTVPETEPVPDVPISQSEPVTPTAAPEPEKKDEPEWVYPITSFNNKNALCLTFDDGGNEKAITKALEILEQHNVKCTFFVIGKYLKSHTDLWKKAVEQGHQICNHTQDHVWLSELSDDEVRKEILDWEASAAKVLGDEYLERMKANFPYLRLPGGAAAKSKRVLKIVAELGYTPIGWNVESYYAVLRNHDLKNEPVASIAKEVAAHIIKKSKGGSIVLLHFNAYDTEKLDEIIQGIKDAGLTLELVSEQEF